MRVFGRPARNTVSPSISSGGMARSISLLIAGMEVDPHAKALIQWIDQAPTEGACMTPRCAHQLIT